MTIIIIIYNTKSTHEEKSFFLDHMFSERPTSLPVLGIVGRKFVRAKPLSPLQEKEGDHDPIVHFQSMT